MVSKAGPAMKKGTFQNGGTVSALMTYALENGAIDAAVLTDQKKMIPQVRLVTEADEILSCASSKYMASPNVSMFNKGWKQGYKKIGIVGTPCHMTAVAKIRCNLMDTTSFEDPTGLTVGLFCTWALDTKDLMSYLSSKIEISTICKMDIPPPPANVLVLQKKDGSEVKLPLDEIRPFIPESCSLCPDMTAEWADISVGAFEGYKEMNVIIIRTKRGDDLVSKAVTDGFLVVEKMQVEPLKALEAAAANKKRRTLNEAMKRGLVNSQGEGKLSMFRLTESTLKQILN